MMKRLALVVSVLIPSVALAGGFEFPDNTAEALGRGGAFTAKADNPSALMFNIAGLARQRGTRLQVDSNIVLHTYEFQREGVYPDDPADPATPYGGTPYPKIRNIGGPQFGPFLGISSDLGIFDRWTFAVGVFGPSSYGKRHYAATIDGKPNPGRYDVQQADLLVVFPTLAAAVRVTKWLDLGLALHLVAGSFDLSNVSFVDQGRAVCPNAEYAGCDSTTQIKTTGFTATAALGIMIKPKPFIQFGINLRGPANIDSSGTVNATAPAVSMLTINPEPAQFFAHLPWVLRAGVRYIFMKEGDTFEHGDVEVNGTYESWQQAEGVGSQVKIPNLSIFSDINPVIRHNYRDTFSLRLGGSYNVRLPAGVLSARLGFAFDSAATAYSSTRLDFDTGAKYIPTVGLGYKVRGVAINVAYAYIYTPDRTVTNGVIRSINGTNGTDVSGVPSRELLPVVNNGRYHAFSHVLSLGITIAWDEALKKKRVLAYD
jgi:long-subunit fatty acid transport protein